MYPPLGLILIRESNNLWRFKSKEAEESIINISIRPDPLSFVYCGSGIWARHSSTDKGEYLLGGPELSDDLLASKMTRWAAKLESKLTKP